MRIAKTAEFQAPRIDSSVRLAARHKVTASSEPAAHTPPARMRINSVITAGIPALAVSAVTAW
jgi:hypothetical protein